MSDLVKTLTLAQIVDRENAKTPEERWSELTTPPKSVGGFVGTGAGAFVLRDLGVPGMVAGAVLGNYVANALRDDLSDPGKLQRDADRDFSRSFDGWLAGKNKLQVSDGLHLAESAFDGEGLVNSVEHRRDPDWHPDMEPLFVNDQETQAALADAGVQRDVGDQLYATDAVSKIGSYRTHWWQLWKRRAPYTS